MIFSFDEPKRPEPKNHSVTFPDLNVLDFNFAAIQLNQLSWRDYLTQQNPVAAALMVNPVRCGGTRTVVATGVSEASPGGRYPKGENEYCCRRASPGKS